MDDLGGCRTAGKVDGALGATLILELEAAARVVELFDPMVATGGSLLHCLELLASRGAADITVVCVLAAPEGLRRLADCGIDLRVVTASVDERLNADAYIVPGLGDAGDRQFGPR